MARGASRWALVALAVSLVGVAGAAVAWWAGVGSSPVHCDSRIEYSCVATVQLCPFHSSPPASMEPGESLVEVTPSPGGSPIILLRELGGWRREVCVEPRLLYGMRVERTLGGPDVPEQFWIAEGRCSPISTRLPDDATRAFMVVRPIEQPLPILDQDRFQPLMHFREGSGCKSFS